MGHQDILDKWKVFPAIILGTGCSRDQYEGASSRGDLRKKRGYPRRDGVVRD